MIPTNDYHQPTDSDHTYETTKCVIVDDAPFHGKGPTVEVIRNEFF